MARKTSFYYSFLVLPAEQRRAIVAVWDFCRAVDDAVDEAPAATGGVRCRPGATRSRSGARSWRAASTAGRRRPPQGRAAAAVRPRRSTCRARRSRTSSTASRWISTRRATRRSRICSSTAGASRRRSGMICIRIFGCRSAARPRLRAEPRRRAAADQHPARRQGRPRARPGLPAARGSCGAHGCTVDDLAAGVVTEPVRRLIEFECRRARDFYQRAQRRAAARGSPAAGGGRDHARRVLRDAAADRAQRLRRVHGAGARAAPATGADRAEAMAVA